MCLSLLREGWLAQRGHLKNRLRSPKVTLGAPRVASPLVTCHRSSQRGFTLVELMMTFILIGIVVTLSIPSFKSITRSHEGLESATKLAQHLNVARDQAIRRNRAYEVVLNELDPGAPSGVVLISEAPANSCQSIVDQPDLISALEISVYGESRVERLPASEQRRVGIAGWRIGREGNFRSERLQLCYNARGALFKRDGSLYSEVGALQINLQKFDGPPWRALGAPHRVELNFSSGAQVKR